MESHVHVPTELSVLFLSFLLLLLLPCAGILAALAWDYLEAGEDDRVFGQSPVLRYFFQVQTDLLKRHGHGVAVPCGVTAEAVESGVEEFTNTQFSSLTDILPTPFTLYRLHFFIDTDNVSDDHVVFLLAGRTALYIFHSYNDILSPRIEKTTWMWLRQAQRMCVTHDTDAWIRVFRLSSQPPVFVKSDATISCHCSYTVL